MSEANMDRSGDFSPDLFSAEELAMMQDADGMNDDAALEPKDLQSQLNAVARLVAEGGERERQLRALINDLTMLATPDSQRRSTFEQTQNLARIVLASSERELQLQQCLETLRGVVMVRAKGVL